MFHFSKKPGQLSGRSFQTDLGGPSRRWRSWETWSACRGRTAPRLNLLMFRWIPCHLKSLNPVLNNQSHLMPLRKRFRNKPPNVTATAPSQDRAAKDMQHLMKHCDACRSNCGLCCQMACHGSNGEHHQVMLLTTIAVENMLHVNAEAYGDITSKLTVCDSRARQKEQEPIGPVGRVTTNHRE